MLNIQSGFSALFQSPADSQHFLFFISLTNWFQPLQLNHNKMILNETVFSSGAEPEPEPAEPRGSSQHTATKPPAGQCTEPDELIQRRSSRGPDTQIKNTPKQT